MQKQTYLGQNRGTNSSSSSKEQVSRCTNRLGTKLFTVQPLEIAVTIEVDERGNEGLQILSPKALIQRQNLP